MSDDYYKIAGPLLLLAGPGTGKTYSLAKRVKYLLEEEKVSPNEITIITFTTAAARNMRERISDPSRIELYIEHSLQPKIMCTMHSLGHRIIREKAHDLGFSDTISVLYSEKLKEIVVGDAAQLTGCKRTEGDDVLLCRQIGKCNQSEVNKCKICNKYKGILRSCSAIDHDDQILFSCDILKNNPDILEKYKLSCKHLLIDEYQDINAGQFELINILTSGQQNGLFVVGDDDQSIYSWRGGSPEYIRSFKQHFGKSAKIAILLKSFRCCLHVLEGAISVISKYDKGYKNKGLFEYNEKAGSKISVHNVPSDEKEAIIVRKIIEKALPSRSVLVLIPNKYFSVEIIKELKRFNIKYTAPLRSPGEGFPLISNLSEWLIDNDNNLALRECIEAFIESPLSSIPSKHVKKVEKIKARENAFKLISKLWEKVLEKNVNNLWESLCACKENDLITNICIILKNFKSLYEVNDDPANFMFEVIKNFAPWKKIQPLLSEVDSWIETSGQIDNIGQGLVNLMTFQGAKGLEADVVCVIGLEDGILPKNGIDDMRLSEQSRLMFVAMTRAVEELHLFHARKRSSDVMLRPIYGKGKSPAIKLSRFIDAISEDHKENIYHNF